MTSATRPFPTAVTIAGFDPAGAAGVLADARTFAAFGLHASAVITSLTFQNRARVFGAAHQSGEVVRSQLMPLLDEYKIVCAKVGMLPTREVVLEVARLFRETELPSPVVDPVMISSSGQRLMDEDALEALVSEIFPVARLITPNIPEATQLAGIPITSEAAMRQAAAIIRERGARAVLIKGGHLLTARPEEAGKMPALPAKEAAETFALPAESIDVLDDEGRVTVFRERRVGGGGLHGSGCVLSAAIAAGLGKAMTLEDSVSRAKTFVWEAIREASMGYS